MKLYFEVVSKDRYYLGDSAHYFFDQHGGSIGRAPSSSWVLEDANSFVSSTHLLVAFREGGFYVTDLSTNGTFRGHMRLQRGIEETQPLQIGEELLLGGIKIKVVSIINGSSHQDSLSRDAFNKDMSNRNISSFDETDIGIPPVLQPVETSSSHKSADECEVLAQQARLADVIAQCYPDVDHGSLISPVSSVESSGVESSDPVYHHEQQCVESKSEIMLDAMIKVLLVETQRQLAVDRIEDAEHYASMSDGNIFRQAASLLEFYELACSPVKVRQDLQEVMQYLVTKGSL